MKARAGVSHMKQRAKMVIRNPFICRPFCSKLFSSDTNGDRKSFKLVGFPFPHQTETVIGLICGNSKKVGFFS